MELYLPNTFVDTLSKLKLAQNRSYVTYDLRGSWRLEGCFRSGYFMHRAQPRCVFLTQPSLKHVWQNPTIAKHHEIQSGKTCGAKALLPVTIRPAAVVTNCERSLCLRMRFARA